MNRPRTILGLTALIVGTLSVVPGIRAAESPVVDANRDAIGAAFAENRRYDPHWGVRFNFTSLYPTDRHEAVESTALAK